MTSLPPRPIIRRKRVHGKLANNTSKLTEIDEQMKKDKKS